MNNFKSLAKDKVTLIKKDGVTHANIVSSVQRNKIYIFDVKVPLEEGDCLVRNLPNGLQEFFTVVDRGYYEAVGSLPAHYQAEVIKKIEPMKRTVSKEIDIYDNKKIKVFLSHRDTVKAEAKNLAAELNKYGVSCFVAHDSIVPMRVWKDEILKALQSMDAFVCFIASDYYESLWTNQEIGYALAKDVPIYLYSFDKTDPEGFKLDIQAVKSGETTLVDLIKKDYATHPALKEALLKKFIDAKDGNFRNAKDCFIEIIHLPLMDQEIETIVAAIEGPAKYINQLKILLSDPILNEHKQNINTKGVGYYYQLLESNIFSQHSSKRYSIAKDEGKETTYIKNKESDSL